MQVQWFPGHMHKARKEILNVLPKIDVVIEVLDARIPFSSENPMIAELRNKKPCIKLLNKSDLADANATRQWQAFLEKDSSVKTLVTSINDTATIRKIPALCRQLIDQKQESFRPLQTMIMGIPNVGKSSIINTLAGKNIAKTGNEPAVTKAQQRIKLENGIALSDTPGVLWQNVENINSGFRLAMTGAIKDTAIDHTEIAWFAVNFFRTHYPSILQARYGLNPLPTDELEIMETIGRKRGCLSGGNLVDLDKVAKIILSEYRAGTLGQLTLESPEDKIRELAETEKRIEEKARLKQQKTEARKKKKQKR